MSLCGVVRSGCPASALRAFGGYLYYGFNGWLRPPKCSDFGQRYALPVISAFFPPARGCAPHNEKRLEITTRPPIFSHCITPIQGVSPPNPQIKVYASLLCIASRCLARRAAAGLGCALCPSWRGHRRPPLHDCVVIPCGKVVRCSRHWRQCSLIKLFRYRPLLGLPANHSAKSLSNRKDTIF